MTAVINVSKVDPSSAHQNQTPIVHNRNNAYQAPYNSSITIVALVAFLSPLTSFLWSLHNVATSTNPNDFDDGDIDYHRHLQANNCNDTAIDSTTYTPTNNDLSSTWAAIQYTTIISSTVGLLCLFGYESFRRDPIVGKYVYDRKRLEQPERTPPPLMLSRSLWRGHKLEDNDAASKSSSRWWCFKVPPAILEIVFLNLDSNYIRYSRAAHEARMERERMGYMACCMTGCFHNNCCNNHVSPSYAHGGSMSRRRRRMMMLDDNEGEGDGDFFMDEDGYAFYPGYNFEYSHVYQDTTGCADDDGDAEGPSSSGISGLPSKKNAYSTSVEFCHPKPKWNKNIDDLFPEDRRANLESARTKYEGRMNLNVHPSLRSSHVEGEVVGGDNVVNTPPTGSFQFLRYAKGKETEKELRGATATSEFSSGPFEKSDLTGGDYELSHTDAKTYGGSSVETSETEDVLFHSTSETLVESIKYMKSAEVGVQDDVNVEADYRSPLLPESRAKSSNTTAGETHVGKDDNKESATDSETELEYPSRLKYFLLPPGFHCWTSVLQFLGYFFYLPAFFQWCHKIPTPSLNLPRVGGKSKVGDNDGSRANAIPIENPGKELTEGEEELLRCAGLDTYLLVRLARFGFDVTFYPGCFSLVVILPIYHSCAVKGNQTLNGYVNRTINVIPDGDNRMNWIVIFTCLLYFYIMRRLWFEWEVFIQLRHKFLASGDPSFHESPTYLRTYRNTSMVECVPQELRSDRKLKDVFESLFPGQIERAEMIINTSDLEKVLKKRQKLIEKYDSLSARYMYESWRYAAWQRGGKNVGICTNHVSKPMEPKVRSGGLFSKRVNAFAFYNEKIKEIDIKAGEEYDILVEHRNKSKEASIRLLEGGEEDSRPVGYNINDVAPLLVTGRVRQFFTKESAVFNGTGMVEFKSIVAKQSAVQCNLSGQPYYMITSDVPDPRDLLWFNVSVDRYTLETRKILVQTVLLLGLFAWGAIVTFITNLTHNTVGGIPSDNFLYPLIKDYVPALVVSLVLVLLPALFFMLAMHVIRFKSHSRCDEFVLVWNTAYRLTNVFLTLFSLSYYEAFNCFKEKPEEFVQSLADKVVRQSTVLMNLVILAAGQETMLQLLQWRSLIKQAVLRPLINLNTKSKRYIDSLNTAPALEQSFLFGFFAPVLSYGLMIALIYAFMAPLMLGICAAFFWIATKVHTHNALFVYCQRCEGGGKLFYYWNRIVFITLYSSIVVFSAILTLKQYIEMGATFLVLMTLVTYCFDKSVTNTFVVNSLYLPISIARHSDAKEDVKIEHSNIEREGRENYMYRDPLLDQENWNSKI